MPPEPEPDDFFEEGQPDAPGTTDDDEYASVTVRRLSRYRCLGCGDALPAGRGAVCDACVEWEGCEAEKEPRRWTLTQQHRMF